MTVSILPANLNLPPFKPKQIIHHGIILRQPVEKPERTIGNTAYELGCCLQLDDTHCLLLASIDEQGGGDLCVGNDAFVFERISDIRPEEAFIVNRGLPDYRMRDGRLAYLAKFPAIGGFVPLEETTSDGSPHPGAGRGFLICNCVTFSPNKTSAIESPESFIEIIQISWDGKSLDFSSPTLLHELMGLRLSGDITISPFCPHNEGMLVPLGIEGKGVIVFRFEWDGESWQPVAHGNSFNVNMGTGVAGLPGEPWSHQPGEIEPSLRRVDEKYYLFTRGVDAYGRFYVSEDGLNFSLVRERANITVPQILNQGLDGSLYVATNHGSGWIRNPLIAYDLSVENAVGIVLHDQDGVRDDQSETIPFVDHAIASNVRLEDRRRHFVFYRVCDLKERTLHKYQIDSGLDQAIHGEHAPASRRSTTGLYLIELTFL